MSTIIKKATFEELYNTFVTVCQNIDALFLDIKERDTKKKVYDGFPTYKDFLIHLENEACKKTAEELKLGETTVRDRWKTLTLPISVYDALEKDEIAFSKAKVLTAINFSLDNPQDDEIANKLVGEIKKDIPLAQIKELVKAESKNIWNSKTVVMEMLASQHGINNSSIF